jgi:hypothetical protein
LKSTGLLFVREFRFFHVVSVFRSAILVAVGLLIVALYCMFPAAISYNETTISRIAIRNERPLRGFLVKS